MDGISRVPAMNRNVYPVHKDSGNSGLVRILVLIILFLLILVVYAYLINPYISGYIIQKQIEARDIVVSTILEQIQKNGYVELYQGNETIILVQYQAPAQTGTGSSGTGN